MSVWFLEKIGGVDVVPIFLVRLVLVKGPNLSETFHPYMTIQTKHSGGVNCLAGVNGMSWGVFHQIQTGQVYSLQQQEGP